MKLKLFILISICVMPVIALAQEQSYIINIIELPSDMGAKNFEVKVDNGQKVDKLKDAKGKKIKFKTRAGALMYFQSLGWEIAGSTSKSEGFTYQGTGASSTNTYWIIRKPASFEEAQRAAENAIKIDDKTDEEYPF